MQEQVNERTVALSVKAANITGRLLAKAMREFLNKAREPAFKTGKQSVTSLARQGKSLANIEIDGSNIGSFSRIARKYHIDFALKKDASETPPKWMVFFKAKDADTLALAFNEYGKLQIKHKGQKPSLLTALEQAKKLVQTLAPPVKNRKRGGPER